MFTRPEAFDNYRPLTRGEIIRRRRVHEPVHVAYDAKCRPVAHEVLRAEITKVRYCRDFGRVEACVAITYSHHPSVPPRTDFLLTNVPLRRAGQPQDLRARLIQSAIGLSIRFGQQHREITLKAA